MREGILLPASPLNKSTSSGEGPLLIRLCIWLPKRETAALW
jgi:hypothetical protein